MKRVRVVAFVTVGLWISSTLANSGCDAGQVDSTDFPNGVLLADFKDELNVRSRYEKTDRDLAPLIQLGEEISNGEVEGKVQACISCHRVSPSRGTAIGPTFMGVGARYADELGGEIEARVWLHHKITDPKKYIGLYTTHLTRGTMPRMGQYFSDDEIEALVEYLMTIKRQEQ